MIGKLNKRIKYNEQGTYTSTPTGGQTYTPGAEVETWCNAEPMNMSMSLRYGLNEATRNYLFTLRYYHGIKIKQGDTLTFNDNEFKVRSIINIDEKNDYVKLTASEQLE